ncbi:membrane-targeted effector domain-containing toxin [Pseudomonas aegrilactucae]|uniref:Membrane-targeted effector domain-containing toxin n=1 Tax=Pseudomonas aegrilactucae TaxID=2854028 RepID=A0A9Q2XLQ1_9PSED|nr:membrane-targeted effector domain-containing toxin [Pseudomonas aegrilactucae]MBV6288401.1 membrane-targeted effector domain-containing toxin [Pseudomonas aegrilactucae]
MPQNSHAHREPLEAIARQLVMNCPDMRQMARELAIKALKRFANSSLDPDTVYLHRFKAAQANPESFSGWEHRELPYQSLTLPQLVMHRFDVSDQDNADLLSYRTGFYREGAQAGVFDQHNEVRMAPADVLRDFWEVDFSSAFRQQMQAFWDHNAQSFRSMAKANFLSKVVEACENEEVPEQRKRYRLLARALAGTTDWPPTLEQLQQTHLPDQGVRLHAFDLGGYVASDILRAVLPDGYQMLYLPGEVTALHLFANPAELYWWLLQNTNEAGNRARFMAHFELASHTEQSAKVGLNHLIDLLFYNWGGSHHAAINLLDKPLERDAFSYLRDAARQRMNDDAHFCLRSNADLRKQMWVEDLHAFARFAGAMAALDWPVALAAVGAGLGETGLSIEQAINGHTTAERQAGVVGAVLASIDTLFNASLLGGVGDAAAALEDAELPLAGKPYVEAEDEPLASVEELDTHVPAPLRPTEISQRLASFETNALLDGETPGRGKMHGIYTLADGFYVSIDDFAYQVRYVGELKRWVVIDPQTPFSFYRNVPIELNAQQQWAPVAQGRLMGGTPRLRLKLWGRSDYAQAPSERIPTPYEVLPDLQAQLRSVDDEQLSGITYRANQPHLENACDQFRTLRSQLLSDAREFLSTVELPPRPQIPLFQSNPAPKQILRGCYARCDGLVIGECHAHLGSKRFLIDNMAQLRKQKVKVLYLEHLLTDFHQADLDVFNRTGQMSANLRDYVTDLDRGQATDRSGRYTFMQVMHAAQANQVRIQAIDCMASYRQSWLATPPGPIRQQMMNFFAHRVIAADQVLHGSSKWVAFVGNTHANLFDGVPGLAELQGAIGLRIEDIEIGQPDRFGIDPGIQPDETANLAAVKCDLLLQVPIAPVHGAALTLEEKLRAIGSFGFTQVDAQLNLVHRSKDSTLHYTPIHRDGRFYYIERASWPRVDKRRMPSLAQLSILVSSNGLKHVSL